MAEGLELETGVWTSEGCTDRLRTQRPHGTTGVETVVGTVDVLTRVGVDPRFSVSGRRVPWTAEGLRWCRPRLPSSQ